MLQNFVRKCKFYLRVARGREDIFVVLVIFLVGFGGFGLGRLSTYKENKGPVRLEYTDEVSENKKSHFISSSPRGETEYKKMQGNLELMAPQGMFVASIGGSAYHHPWCPGAEQIKKENKIWFSSKEEAERAGYTGAKNCKGL